MEKGQLIKQIIASLSESLGLLEKAARASHAEATHESSKAESKYDTRGIEAAYLAGGQARQAKLIDFGLATNFLRDSAASSSTGHVGQEHFRGNFATASPEQILEHPLDGRSDLFSLGITLWWLLIGRNPFAGVKRGALIAERVSPASYVVSEKK